MKELASKLKKSLGDDVVLEGESITEKYVADWSGHNPHLPAAVFRPSSTEQISIILKACNDVNQQVVIQGGMTGLCGGGTPRENEVVLSMERLNQIEDVDRDSMTITTAAGTPLQVIQETALSIGCIFPLDIGSRGSCQIGGNISTNAGGNQVIRYGMTRSLVLGLEAVMADGTIVSSMNKLLKNNAGYDLKHLLIGTEGTLGVITRVVLRLFPLPKSQCTALCGIKSFENTRRFLNIAREEFTGSLNSFEVMWSSFIDVIMEHNTELRNPFDTTHEISVLLEIKGQDQSYEQEKFESVLFSAIEQGLIEDAVIAKTQKETEQIWSIRDGIAAVIPVLKGLATFDIGINIGDMPLFLEKVENELNAEFSKINTFTFGHIGDGNLHYGATTGKEEDIKKIHNIIYKEVGRFDGSISAEHGIGIQKKDYLELSRNDGEIQMMRTLKTALDPKGILNPGRIF